MYLDVPPAIESALVRAFRLSQSLLHLTQDERQALLRGDVPRLLVLADRKETLLDQLAGLSDAHHQAAHILSLTLVAPLPPIVYFTGYEPAETPEQDSEPVSRARLRCLLEGIQVLAAQIRDLAQGNASLASIALNRASSQQAGLLSDARADLPALFAALLASREPPNPREPFPPVPNHRPETTLIEAMTNLYRQETAYRAVLKVSSRVLTSP
jgi:flagellar biosynthesis/type III secretory pathway chaperone